MPRPFSKKRPSLPARFHLPLSSPVVELSPGATDDQRDRGRTPRGRARQAPRTARPQLCYPARQRHRPARPEWQRQDHAHARDRRRAEDRQRHRHRARPAGRREGAARQGRLPHTGAQRVRGSDGPGERPLFRLALRRRRGQRRPGDHRRRAGPGQAPTRRQPLRRPTRPRIARLRDPRPPGGTRARRADGRSGSGAPQRVVAAVPRVRQGGDDDPRLQSRDGRGRPLRPPAVHPRGRAHRRRHPGQRPAADRDRGPGEGLPAADRGEGVMALNTAARILRQLRHDRRTIAMILVVPTLLLTLLRYLYDSQPLLFDRVGLIMLGLFPLVIMFLLTSVAMLRERTTGTLERLLTTPIRKVDILLGYGLAFAVAAAVQAAIVSALAYLLLGLDTLGPAWLVAVMEIGRASRR